MTATAPPLPRWDMTPFYPNIDSPELIAAQQQLAQHLEALTALFDQHGVGKHEPHPLDDTTISTFDTVLARLNAVLAEQHTLFAYVYCFVTTDSRNDLAQAKLSEL